MVRKDLSRQILSVIPVLNRTWKAFIDIHPVYSKLIRTERILPISGIVDAHYLRFLCVKDWWVEVEHLRAVFGCTIRHTVSVGLEDHYKIRPDDRE